MSTQLISEAEAQLIMTQIPETLAWDLATSEERNKALYEASDSVMLLDLDVDLTGSEIPEDIQKAICYIVLTSLEGARQDANVLRNTLSSSVGTAKVTFRERHPVNVLAGIGDPFAWRILRGYLKDPNVIRME